MQDDMGTLAQNPLVVAQATETGAVLLHMSTGDCFELNHTGLEVWSLLAERATLATIAAAIAARHGVPETTVESDVRALLAELKRHGLVAPAPP